MVLSLKILWTLCPSDIKGSLDFAEKYEWTLNETGNLGFL